MRSAWNGRRRSGASASSTRSPSPTTVFRERSAEIDCHHHSSHAGATIERAARLASTATVRAQPGPWWSCRLVSGIVVPAPVRRQRERFGWRGQPREPRVHAPASRQRRLPDRGRRDSPRPLLAAATARATASSPPGHRQRRHRTWQLVRESRTRRCSGTPAPVPSCRPPPTGVPCRGCRGVGQHRGTSRRHAPGRAPRGLDVASAAPPPGRPSDLPPRATAASPLFRSVPRACSAVRPRAPPVVHPTSRWYSFVARSTGRAPPRLQSWAGLSLVVTAPESVAGTWSSVPGVPLRTAAGRQTTRAHPPPGRRTAHAVRPSDG